MIKEKHIKGLKEKSTGKIVEDSELKKQWEKELTYDLEKDETLEEYKKKVPFEKWKQYLIDTNDYEEVEDVIEAFYKKICNKYVKTRGQHYILEADDGIHYLELDDEYDNVNKDNYKRFLKNGEDTVFKTYQNLYKDIVEYNIYEDLQDSNFGYTIKNFYLSKEELEKLQIDVVFGLEVNKEINSNRNLKAEEIWFEDGIIIKNGVVNALMTLDAGQVEEIFGLKELNYDEDYYDVYLEYNLKTDNCKITIVAVTEKDRQYYIYLPKAEEQELLKNLLEEYVKSYEGKTIEDLVEKAEELEQE